MPNSLENGRFAPQPYAESSPLFPSGFKSCNPGVAASPPTPASAKSKAARGLFSFGEFIPSSAVPMGLAIVILPRAPSLFFSLWRLHLPTPRLCGEITSFSAVCRAKSRAAPSINDSFLSTVWGFHRSESARHKPKSSVRKGNICFRSSACAIWIFQRHRR